jgi:hypothetical protein
MKKVSKKVGIVKKAQTGVQVSKKDMKANPEDFKFLRKSETKRNKKVTAGKLKAYKGGGSMKTCKNGCS